MTKMICQHTKTIVTSTKTGEGIALKKRYRKCLVCKNSFSTLEILEKDKAAFHALAIDANNGNT
jgi:transcriptional regulator NrdR family protein